jgi:hypothetical protein
MARRTRHRQAFPESGVITISRHGTRIGEADFGRLRDAYDARHHVRLPGFFADDLLALLDRDLTPPNFQLSDDGDIARELALRETPAFFAVMFLLNCPVLFDAIARIIGMDGIRRFDGRIYRMRAGADFYDSWHSDVGQLDEPRLAAISVNLGGPYGGGTLQMRERESERVIEEIRNQQRGDAILFRVSPSLQHRLLPVEGEAPRTACAGWFVRAPQALPIAVPPRPA